MFWDNVGSGIIGFLSKVLYDRVAERTPKIVFNVESIRGFNLAMPSPQPHIQVWQHSLHLTNEGKTPATNVVITHDYLPSNQNITQHAVSKCIVDHVNKTIRISSLAPREVITITYLDFMLYSTITYIVYDQGVANHVPLLITRPANGFKIFSLWFFAVIGALSTTWWLWFKSSIFLQRISNLIK